MRRDPQIMIAGLARGVVFYFLIIQINMFSSRVVIPRDPGARPFCQVRGVQGHLPSAKHGINSAKILYSISIPDADLVKQGSLGWLM
jgi:hypothetical protein